MFNYKYITKRSINDACFLRKFEIAKKKIVCEELTGYNYTEYQDPSVILDFNLEIVSRAAP